MNVLVVGYGSIGRRHISNLLELEFIDKIIVYTKIKKKTENIADKKIFFIDASSMSLDVVADRNKIDFAIIANETYKHINTATILAGKGIDLFIEKPLSHNLDELDLLKGLIRKNHLKVFVAYNLRYLLAIQIIKDQISQKVIGDLYFARIEVGQYLPSWRSTVNYTDSYSAKSEYGGGVALDLSHEIDYIRYLFGEPDEWKTFKSKVSELAINSEDIFEGIYKYKNGFICHVHMDYLQRKPVRKIRIVGSKGEVYCDLIGKMIDVNYSGRKSQFFKEENLFRLEDTYKVELRQFIESLGSDKIPAISIEDGIKTLELLKDSRDR